MNLRGIEISVFHSNKEVIRVFIREGHAGRIERDRALLLLCQRLLGLLNRGFEFQIDGFLRS
mgnify:FL=1